MAVLYSPRLIFLGLATSLPLVAPYVDPVDLVAQNVTTAKIVGRVVSPVGNPIEGVELAIPGTGFNTVTNEKGEFALSGVPVGRHYVRVRRIGYNMQLLVVDLGSGEEKTAVIALDRGAYELPDLAVAAATAKPIEYGWTTRYDDFFRRKRTGLGAFISRADIEKRKPLRTPNLLVGLAGIRLRFHEPGPFGTGVEFSRCTNVGVWVDGDRQYVDRIIEGSSGNPISAGAGLSRGLGELLERYIPSQIEMVEVYRGSSEMPAEFIDNTCAAIVIWTR